ncbi:MAG: Na-translocating system protein MpsC family protein [Nitrospiraceae bacterium]
MMHNESVQQQEALEAAVRKAICQFQSEFVAGSFGERIRVLVAPDMIVLRSKGELPAAGQQLIHTEEGQALMKQL